MNPRTIKNICQDIYDELGAGCSEATYQRALEYELMTTHKVCVIREFYLNKMYKNICVSTMRPDLVITDWNCIIEVKAVGQMTKKDFLQAKQYSKMSNMKVILVNFGYDCLTLKLI